MSFNTPRLRLDCECQGRSCAHHGGSDRPCDREGHRLRKNDLVLCKTCRENATKAKREKQ